jgi:hypothetical protein
MNLLLFYLAGLATPFVLLVAFMAYLNLQDWREARRYQQAWDKFGLEFASLTPGQLEFHQRLWAKHPETYGHYTCDRDRYFRMRWQNGFTTDV